LASLRRGGCISPIRRRTRSRLPNCFCAAFLKKNFRGRNWRIWRLSYWPLASAKRSRKWVNATLHARRYEHKCKRQIAFIYSMFRDQHWTRCVLIGTRITSVAMLCCDVCSAATQTDRSQACSEKIWRDCKKSACNFWFFLLQER
jgi:hypothetical protein